MLARFPSSIPSTAASLARSAAPAIQRAPSCVRFNSSEAVTSTPATEAKKRGVPLAQNLGDITIRARSAPSQNRGPRREGDNRPRHNGAPRNANAPRQTNGGPRPQGWQARQNNNDKNGRAPPAEAQDSEQSHVEQRQAASSPKRDRVVIPIAAQVELAGFDELFTPAAQLNTPSVVANSASISPSQARVQLLLERTAGDYCRYARPFPTTDVKKLGPSGLGEFVLSRNRDVGLQSRVRMLTVVQKFVGGQGAQATPQ
ncbi:hypothetical protein C8Q74DRAFT_1237208 [Fomes fomentarius]|nr:hypothetical protein C8Q74DRAFT_1237208 [Fomes fomentarius]